MWSNAHDAYLESRILSADPIELVNLLYQACTGAVRDARHYLANGEIAARSRSITKASEILIELTTSLDHERGGELSERLALLYDYMLRRLTEANFQQTDAPLDEVLGLLSTLSEAWDGLKPTERSVAVPASPWLQAAPQAAPQESASAGAQGWSF